MAGLRNPVRTETERREGAASKTGTVSPPPRIGRPSPRNRSHGERHADGPGHPAAKHYFTCARISSTALSMAACSPSGFLPPAVAKKA